MGDWTQKEWDVFFAIYAKLPRGGPGDDVSTAAAYRMFNGLPDKPRIMDVGCGPGMQTLVLARLSKGEIWAIDNNQSFFDALKRNAERDGLNRYIKILNQDMNKLDVPEKYFDLIWSEGAIYFKGYENALRDWKKYFRDRIRFAFTEANWFENDVPDGARRVWEEYPLTGIEETLRRIRNLGYDVKWFKLPTESWSINYYKPLQTALDAYCKSAPLSGAAKTVTASIQQEIDDYAKYFRYYGYTFYICEEKATG